MVKTVLDSFDGQLVATMEKSDGSLSRDTPFRMFLIGDWSGRANRGALSSTEELKTWRPLLLDRDNVDQLIAHLGVRLTVPLRGDDAQQVTIRFTQLDDFHPDRLFSQLGIFDSLRRLRAKLEDPKSYKEAAAEVGQWPELTARQTTPQHSTCVPTQERPADVHHISESSVLDEILESGVDHAPSANLSRPTEEISAEISKLAEAAVKPYLTPDIESDQERMLTAVDDRIASTINQILHHPDFQALESSWRALSFLTDRLETGAELKLYLLDISFDEFKADLLSSDDVRESALSKLIVEQTVGTPGATPCSLIVGNYTFDFAAGDSELVELISVIAKEAGAPFIAGTTSYLLGCESLAATPDPGDWQELPSDIEQSWQRITDLPSAEYIGFALPRFLLRLPYGKRTEPTEEFEFEELGDHQSEPARHESYLWANAAFAVAYLLAKGFSERGWAFRPSDFLEIENLPLHIYEHQGESEIKPCAEVLLTVRAAEQIIDRGLMPLLSMKNSDTARLGMLQSITGESLGGRWGQATGS